MLHNCVVTVQKLKGDFKLFLFQQSHKHITHKTTVKGVTQKHNFGAVTTYLVTKLY